jgi:hypothetical protein
MRPRLVPLCGTVGNDFGDDGGHATPSRSSQMLPTLHLVARTLIESQDRRPGPLRRATVAIRRPKPTSAAVGVPCPPRLRQRIEAPRRATLHNSNACPGGCWAAARRDYWKPSFCGGPSVFQKSVWCTTPGGSSKNTRPTTDDWAASSQHLRSSATLTVLLSYITRSDPWI